MLLQSNRRKTRASHGAPIQLSKSRTLLAGMCSSSHGGAGGGEMPLVAPGTVSLCPECVWLSQMFSSNIQEAFGISSLPPPPVSHLHHSVPVWWQYFDGVGKWGAARPGFNATSGQKRGGSWPQVGNRNPVPLFLKKPVPRSQFSTGMVATGRD